MINHERIWLEPWCCADPYVGRQWSEHPEPGDSCEEGKSWTEYVRADILHAENERLREALQTANGVVVSGTLKLNEARKRVAKLEAVLKFYAEDCGNYARAALKGNGERVTGPESAA